MDSDFTKRDEDTVGECFALLDKLRGLCDLGNNKEGSVPNVLVQGILQALGLRRMLVDLYGEAIKNRAYAASDETLRSTMHRASLLLMQSRKSLPSERCLRIGMFRLVLVALRLKRLVRNR